jgi:4-amino-4-deoxy-L-arabinose transferase-like glycosyltransferase
MSLPRAAWVWILAGALLALHFAMAVGSKLHESTTSDELVHVTGGVSYWKFNDYRLQPENGNLPQRWVALPAWLSGAKFPDLDQPYWRASDVWVMGHEFFYETGEDHFPRLMAARAMAALFSVALGALVFLWSLRLFGLAGAFVSLVLFTFSPTLLSHGAYATSDGCIALFMLASVGAYWRHLGRPGRGPFALSALVFGLACVAKFSAVFLIPMMALCAAAHLAARRREPARVLLSALGHAAAAYGVIWAFYGFRYSAFNPAVPAADQFIESWPVMYSLTGGPGRLIHLLADLRALPEAFLYGAAYVVQTSQMRGAFLNGEYSITGWRSFFVWTFVLKSTVPFLCASALGLWFALRRVPAGDRAPGRPGLLALTPLLALLGVYWAVSISSHLNIGHRHLVPIYPPLFILAGALGAWAAGRGRWRAALVGALLLWHAAESASIAPHYLAYFNELAGGPDRGFLHLADSNLDWGQDLPGLRDWLRDNRRPGEKAYLAYFGTGEPRYYRLPVERLAYMNTFQEDEPYIPLGPGLYCIGATMLQQVYSTVRGPWTAEREREYEDLRSVEPLFRKYAEDPASRPELDRRAPPGAWHDGRDRFLHLRFARLCYYLRVRRPEAKIGYSIFVYRLSAEEVRAATEGSLRDWSQLIERAGTGAAGG